MTSRTEYEEALSSVQELNPSAAVLAKAQQKIRDPNVDINDLEHILKADAAITSDVLRLSNSAYYNSATVSKDLTTAISRIGLDEVLKLIGLSISKNVMDQDLHHYNMTARAFMSESVSTALLMEILARIIGFSGSESYTLGLLSNVGKLVIDQLLHNFGEEEIYDGSMPLIEWERKHLGFDHSFAGAKLLKLWDFPSEITNPILYQFIPEKVEEDNEELQKYIRSLGFTREMIAAAGYAFENENIEMTDSMEQFINDYMVDEEELVNGLVDAGEKFNTVKRELDIH